MSLKPAALTEPIEIAKFSKNRQKAAIIVSLTHYEGRNLIDVREHFMGSDGRLRPTTKGLAMDVRRLPELSRALRLALEKARALNLLPGDGGE